MKTGRDKKVKRIFCIALALLLISSIGASVVQSNFGSVKVQPLKIVASSGNTLAANLYIPSNATKENPAPAIVTSHGWHNNKEMQDCNFVEYARRGYVVIALDLYCHGDSTKLPGLNHQKGDYWNDENNADGLYDAVKYLATLPYVDINRIGVTGHSKGGEFSTIACELDNREDVQLISAVLLICSDPENTTDASAFTGLYGTRDVGVVAVQYDEFYHRVAQPDGTNSAPRDYINTVTAQTFLNFNEAPTETRSSYTVYTKDIDGENVMRVIYNPVMIHPWATMSASVVKSSVEFFEQALGAPTPLASTNQIWQIKVVFNTLGLVALFMFFVTFILLMLNTKVFACLKADGPVEPSPMPTTGKGKAWLIGSTLAIMIFSIIFYFIPWNWIVANMSTFFKQLNPFFIGVWSAGCGLFTLLVLILNYQFNGKSAGVNLKENGALPGVKKALLGILLGITAAAVTYGIVFISNYFFQTDYRLWLLTFRAFDVSNFSMILRFLPFYFIYYVINSISINCFNYLQMGKKGWVNTLVMAILNGLPSALMFVFMYGYFFATGYQVFEGLGVSAHLGTVGGLWLMPIIVILPVAAVISRIIYKATKNPYIAGTGMAIMIAVMACTNTLTLA